MIKEILLVHHSHTDIGYTHPQPIVFELHDRFIETALDLAEADEDFRWTCEITGTTRAWWERASNSDRDRFLTAVHRGQIEVAALEWHLTPLADLSMLVRSLRNVQFFRDLGVPVRSAMNTDVNGVPWGLVDVLLDHGIDGFSMASNSHFGAPVMPRPGAFRWRSPSGRELLVWNGFQYWHIANVMMGMPSSVETVAAAMPSVLAEAERRGYSLPFLPLQITNPHHPDNAPPDRTLPEFVRNWNGRDPEVRLKLVRLTDVFDRLREESLPVLSGDWTDYWNFGAGSSARETTVLMDGLRTLEAAHQTSAWPLGHEPRERQHLDAAHEGLALYAEHTWGADCSINQPESIETRLQWSAKSAYVYRGLAEARLVLRDGLHRLAKIAGGEEPTLLLYNPLSVPVQVPVRLPASGLDWPLTPGVHHRQRLDGAINLLSDEAFRWCRVDLPPLGYRTYSVADLPLASSAGLESRPEEIRSNRLCLTFPATGGVTSLTVDGVEYIGGSDEFTFGVPILERPSGGSRKEIMRLDFNQFEPAEGWQRNWSRDVVPGRLRRQWSRTMDGAVERIQAFDMDNGDRVDVTYRLFADDPSVDVEVVVESAGDAEPYSLALPFILPQSGKTVWHFDTAGAIVEFDREQLPNAARHFVTARRFVRMQTEQAALSIATPDLPLWKFGGMFFGPSSDLDPADREPVTLAWLTNNYWEVNFLADQSGQTRYRLRLMPHAPEPVEVSVVRTLPHAVPPRLHAYREMGPAKRTAGRLIALESEGFAVDQVAKDGSDVLVTLVNLRETPSEAVLRPEGIEWSTATTRCLEGLPKDNLVIESDGRTRVPIAARAITTVRLSNVGRRDLA